VLHHVVVLVLSERVCGVRDEAGASGQAVWGPAEQIQENTGIHVDLNLFI